MEITTLKNLANSVSVEGNIIVRQDFQIGTGINQNHRIVRVGRQLWKSSSPSSCQDRVTCSRQHLEQECPREGHSTTFLGSLSQSYATLNVSFYFMFRWHFMCPILWPLPLILSLGTTEKSLAASS